MSRAANFLKLCNDRGIRKILRADNANGTLYEFVRTADGEPVAFHLIHPDGRGETIQAKGRSTGIPDRET